MIHGLLGIENGTWLIAIGAVLAILFPALFYIFKRSEVYKISLEIVRNAGALIERIGEPVKAGWYAAGSYQIDGDTTEVLLYYSVRGPRGRGRVTVEAKKRSGRWSCDKIEVALRGSKEILQLASGSTSDYFTHT